MGEAGNSDKHEQSPSRPSLSVHDGLSSLFETENTRIAMTPRNDVMFIYRKKQMRFISYFFLFWFTTK